MVAESGADGAGKSTLLATVAGLLPVVRRIADETHAVVVLVEQHVELALDVVDEAVVLVRGGIALSGPAVELAADPGRVRAAYLGADLPAPKI